jgi:methylmalonyl-CoA mutase C-terminal domain/subunit
MVVHTAIQEDVDVIGLSLLSGAHMTLFTDVTKILKEKNMEDVLVLGGGIIPEEDVPELNRAGIKGIFGPGTPMEEIINFIRENVKE